MGKVTYRGFQRSASNAPQPIGIIYGKNLRRMKEGSLRTRTVQAKLFSRGAVEGVKVVAIVGTATLSIPKA